MMPLSPPPPLTPPPAMPAINLLHTRGRRVFALAAPAFTANGRSSLPPPQHHELSPPPQHHELRSAVMRTEREAKGAPEPPGHPATISWSGEHGMCNGHCGAFAALG